MMLVKYPIMGLSYAHGVFAICGGGGSMKSGIYNTVDVYELSDADPSGFAKVMSADTGKELACGVEFSPDGSLIAVAVDATCWVYELNLKDKTMTLLVKFRSDFASHEASQTTACFAGNGTLLTGGEDGVVRVWKLSSRATDEQKAAGTSSSLLPSPREPGEAEVDVKEPTVGDIAVQGDYVALLTREYRGHTKRIREIHIEPSHRNLVASSSEDQSCHLWRLSERSPIFKLSKDDALDISYQMLKLKPLKGIKKHQFRCVRFSNDGRSLYTVLTPARGDTLLLKWKPATLSQVREGEWRWEVESAVVAGDRPIGSLCISPDDRFIGTASVSGDVRVFLASSLCPYKRRSAEEHTFAVTGMSFIMPTSRSAETMQLVTGGADKSVICHTVPMSGGEASSGLGAIVGALTSALGSVVNLVMTLLTTALIVFVLLLMVHTKKSLLLASPLVGFKDLIQLRFASPDALVSLGVAVLAISLALVLFKRSSLSFTLFMNGVLCFVSTLASFHVAISPDADLQWKTGVVSFDELLDYKISIVLGLACMGFLLFHSVSVMFS